MSPGPLYPLVEEGQTGEEPLIEHGGGGLIATGREQVLLVVNGPLVTVRVTLTV